MRGLAWGPEDGARVLALHGWLDNAASFAPLAQALPPGLRLVAPDLPGHGRSDPRGAGAGYHDVELVADALAIADALGWPRFALLGHSLGAKIASLVAGTEPSRVRSLVLLEGLGPARVPPEAAPHRLARYARLRDRWTARPRRPEADLDALVARQVASGVGLSGAAARRLAERGTEAVHGGVRTTTDPRLQVFSPAAFSEAEVDAFLRRVACPVLLVRATRGYGFEPETLVAQRAAIATLEEQVLEGGHYLHMDAPAAVATAIGARLHASPDEEAAGAGPG